MFIRTENPVYTVLRRTAHTGFVFIYELTELPPSVPFCA